MDEDVKLNALSKANVDSVIPECDEQAGQRGIAVGADDAQIPACASLYDLRRRQLSGAYIRELLSVKKIAIRQHTGVLPVERRDCVCIYRRISRSRDFSLTVVSLVTV